MSIHGAHGTCSPVAHCSSHRHPFTSQQPADKKLSLGKPSTTIISSQAQIMPDALFLYFNKEHYKSKSSYLLETSTIFVKILTQSFFKDYHHEKYQKKIVRVNSNILFVLR